MQARAQASRRSHATTQLTVRGVDTQLERRLREEAERRGLSVNRTVLQLLRDGVGLTDSPGAGRARRTLRYDDLDHLAGTWSDQDAREFDAALGKMRRVEPELWR